VRQFDEEQIRESLRESLDIHQPKTTFAEVWGKYNKRGHGLSKLKIVPQAALIAILAFLAFGFALTPRVDKIDYPFRDDPAVIGKWITVDLVQSPDRFIPGKKRFNKELYVTSMVFIKDGSMLWAYNAGNGQLSPGPWRWTRGKILDREYKTASQYTIKGIQGTSYMFCEWKNGDYQYFHRKPHYFVLKQIDDQDYSDYKVVQTTDKIDYPFIVDKQAVGSWQAVDFVSRPEKFDPGSTHIPGEPLLQTMDFRDDGRLLIKTLEGNQDLIWTNNYIINDKAKTASKYIIKEIDGKQYMFMEWKNGDYMYRGVKPSYYVFEKKSL